MQGVISLCVCVCEQCCWSLLWPQHTTLSPALGRSPAGEAGPRLAFNWRRTVGHESHSAPSLLPEWVCFPLSDSLTSSLPSPPCPVWRMSVKCGGARHRNKAPYWAWNLWVNVRLGHKLQETGLEKRRK